MPSGNVGKSKNPCSPKVEVAQLFMGDRLEVDFGSHVVMYWDDKFLRQDGGNPQKEPASETDIMEFRFQVSRVETRDPKVAAFIASNPKILE